MPFEEIGYEVINNFISTEQVDNLLSALAYQKLEPLKGGIRRIEQLVPEIAVFANSQLLLSSAANYLQSLPSLVRAIYFEKTPENNWYVTWHQDRTVAVSSRIKLDGWGPWSQKSGAWHVQPPLEVLKNMVTLRVHLDPATRANGCLKVIPGSHLTGILHTSNVHEQVDESSIVYCEVPSGGAVVMRPHILHASEKTSDSTPRRVLHFEYSAFKLPAGVSWY